jgi:hypothetical protein
MQNACIRKMYFGSWNQIEKNNFFEKKGMALDFLGGKVFFSL